MLNKLVDILGKLACDPDTHVTVITTNDVNFCQGVDLAELVASGSIEKRKIAAKHLLAAVKKYLKALALFPKPLIVGVNGHIMNLGVTQLALFDIVVAGDKCTYETPYVKFGQVPEGYSIWNCLNKIRGSFKTKLFWLSEKVQSTEAVLSGLVTKLTTPQKVNEEAVIIAKKIAAMSPEAFRVMKSTTTHGRVDVINSSFVEEFNAIAEQWSSYEFLENIKKYLQQGHF